MNGQFTKFCRRYYELICLLDQQETRFATMLANALPYTGQTHVNELDAIIRCNLKIQRARAQADDTIAAMRRIENIIIQIMAYFDIEPHTTLTCEVPGLYELAIWADNANIVYCIKTNNLAPIIEDENIITIQLINKGTASEDEDDE